MSISISLGIGSGAALLLAASFVQDRTHRATRAVSVDQRRAGLKVRGELLPGLILALQLLVQHSGALLFIIGVGLCATSLHNVAAAGLVMSVHALITRGDRVLHALEVVLCSP